MARAKRIPRFGKTGCLFWLLILAVIVVIILYRGKGSFRETLKSLGKRVKKEVSEVQKPEKPRPIEKKQEEVEIVEEEPEISEEKPEEAEEEKTVSPPKEVQKEEEKRPEERIRAKKLNATLYFVKINESDGSAKPYPVTRTVEYLDSPITKTINALLRGSSPSERKNGIISFIPEETKLLEAEIYNGHLTLNFSSHIEENYSGRDAILLEILQIMLTAFDFDQVKKVSILINGKKKNYITGEGIPLKSIYTREDLSRLYTGG